MFRPRARHERITKQGPCHARTMLVEAAWQAVRGPGPLRAFYERVRGRRGTRVAAVAVAGKITVIVWHLLTRGENYAWVRPALHAKKLRDLELRSGYPARRGQRGAGYAYNLARSRREERRRGEQAEAAYKRLTQGGPSEAGERLRMPQRRNDNEDSVARPSPPAQLFVSRSPADAIKIARAHERGIQPHPWSLHGRAGRLLG